VDVNEEYAVPSFRLAALDGASNVFQKKVNLFAGERVIYIRPWEALVHMDAVSADVGWYS
jgi:hypothetical protein